MMRTLFLSLPLERSSNSLLANRSRGHKQWKHNTFDINWCTLSLSLSLLACIKCNCATFSLFTRLASSSSSSSSPTLVSVWPRVSLYSRYLVFCLFLFSSPLSFCICASSITLSPERNSFSSSLVFSCLLSSTSDWLHESLSARETPAKNTCTHRPDRRSQCNAMKCKWSQSEGEAERHSFHFLFFLSLLLSQSSYFFLHPLSICYFHCFLSLLLFLLLLLLLVPAFLVGKLLDRVGRKKNICFVTVYHFSILHGDTRSSSLRASLNVLSFYASLFVSLTLCLCVCDACSLGSLALLHSFVSFTVPSSVSCLFSPRLHAHFAPVTATAAHSSFAIRTFFFFFFFFLRPSPHLASH